MTDVHIEYRSGYKYQLAKDYHADISIKPDTDIDTPFIMLDKQGNLTVKSGYAWDGTSGPVVDTAENMRASLVHDALYQLIRIRKLPARKNRDKADKLFKKMCRQDGVLSAVAQVYYQALKALGKPSADPKNAKPPLRAPL